LITFIFKLCQDVLRGAARSSIEIEAHKRHCHLKALRAPDRAPAGPHVRITLSTSITGTGQVQWKADKPQTARRDSQKRAVVQRRHSI